MFANLAVNMTGKATVVRMRSHFLPSSCRKSTFPAVLREGAAVRQRCYNPVAVGDIVTYSIGSDAYPAASGAVSETARATLEHPATIISVEPRRNYIIRRSSNLSRQSHVIAANLDRAFLIATLYFPEIKLPFLDRFLVTCEVYGIPVTIVLNKVDLFREDFPDALADFHRIYESAGYPILETSARTGEGLPNYVRLRKIMSYWQQESPV